MNGSSVLALCVLVCTGLALDCEWDQPPGHEQGPTFFSFSPADKEDRSCLEACCSSPDCDLVLVLPTGNTTSRCQKVDCTKNRDLCDLKPAALLRIYRKKGNREAGRQATGGGDKLLESSEPRTNQTNNVRCRQPMKIGFCRAAFPKFYYDVTNQSCKRFIYGGCGGNTNNFDSQEECEVSCSGVTGSVLPDESTAAPESPSRAAWMDSAFNSKMPPDEFTERCGAEPQVGPCRAAFQRWYYNSKTGHCESFIYGGCKANKNNYESKESCMTTCTVSVLPSSRKAAADDVSTEYKEKCMVTSDPGPCRAAFPMFYYDPNTGTCQSFLYGGCHGNQNRYGTMEQCMSCCSRDGSFDTRGKARDRWTPAVFLFVTLAAISALLLAALFVITTVRRQRLTRHPSSISDKEELLPDPDEQSSLESLTIPESPKPGQT